MRQTHLSTKKIFVFILCALTTIALYFLFIRSALGTAGASLAEMIVIGILALLAVGTLLAAIFTLVRIAFS